MHIERSKVKGDMMDQIQLGLGGLGETDRSGGRQSGNNFTKEKIEKRYNRNRMSY